MTSAMKEIDTFAFREHGTGDEAVAIVQAGRDLVSLALSIRTDGDLHVVMGMPDARRLIVALQLAIDRAAEGSTGGAGCGS
jgi:hypothetical protein